MNTSYFKNQEHMLLGAKTSPPSLEASTPEFLFSLNWSLQQRLLHMIGGRKYRKQNTPLKHNGGTFLAGKENLRLELTSFLFKASPTGRCKLVVKTDRLRPIAQMVEIDSASIFF
jgi:hypothetical protein